MDTVVALVAGMVIFPIVFANGLEPSAGPGLVFVSLPIAFGEMPGGILFGTLFFVLLTFAAWTSSIGLIEPAVAWLVENRGMSRLYASVWIGLATWVVGLGTVFSFNIWGDVHPLDRFQAFAGKTLFDLQDYLASNVMLPLGGILIAVFVGWVVSADDAAEELGLQGSPWFSAWRVLVRYVCPIAIACVLLFNLF